MKCLRWSLNSIVSDIAFVGQGEEDRYVSPRLGSWA